MNLNEFHEKIRLRGEEAFAGNHHTRVTAGLAVISELGEIADAVVGVVGCEKRKAHLTNADVLDGVGDAATYLSILADKIGVSDLDHAWSICGEMPYSKGPREDWALLIVGSLSASVADAGLNAGINMEEAALFIGRALKGLERLAVEFGCDDFFGLLASVFNHVSARCGSVYRVSL